MSGRRLLSGADRNRARPSTASSSRRNHADSTIETAGVPELPDYEPPSFALDKDGRKALEDLSTNRDANLYADHIQQSLKLLSDSVRDINDRYSERKNTLKARQERRRGENRDGAPAAKTDRERAEEDAVLALRELVPPLTDECELSVREIIDLQIELEDGKSALQETVRAADVEIARARQRANDGGGDGLDDDNEALEIVGPWRTFQETKQKLAGDYAAKTMYERYAINNDYIGFKRMAHDAIHGTDGKPLPDPSRWFTQNGRRADEDEDEEDDLIIAEESIDIHCPLSMTVMDDPYTCRKCKHTFNKSSLDGFFIRRGEQKKCPQTGCGQEVRVYPTLSYPTCGLP